MSAVAVKALRAYEGSVQRHPLATKAATCAVGFGLGDLCAQTIGHIQRKRDVEATLKASGIDTVQGLGQGSVVGEQYDLTRTLSMSLFGGLVAAPQMHLFFTWLDKAVMPRSPSHPIAVAFKVLIDQGLNSPLGTCLFFTWSRALQGNVTKARSDIHTKLWPTTQASWQLWPAAQALNFFLVPAHFRIIFINAVAIVWTSILSTINSS